MKVGETLIEWLPLLGGLAWKSLVVFALAGTALLALRRASASARHLVCLLTLAALLALPGLSLALPSWHLPVPIPQEEPIPAHNFDTLPSEGRVEAVTNVSRPILVATSLPAPSMPPVSAPSPRVFPWFIVLPALWFLGFVLALLRPLLGLWGIGCLSRASVSVKDTLILALTAKCASALTLKSAPALRQAASPVPMTWGWRQPVILLPLDAQTWPEERLRAVLLHELAHVRRRDWLSHRFADFVCALYWFHPFVWLAARRLRSESEIACDDLVLTSGIAAPDYARHLLDVARALRPASAAVPQAAIAMARTTQIEGRLKMILDHKRSRRALTRRVLLLALIPGMAAITGLAMLRPAAKAASNAVAPVVASVNAPVNAVRSIVSPMSPHPPLLPKKANPVSAVSLLTLARMLAVTPKAAALTPKPLRVASVDATPKALLSPTAEPVAPALAKEVTPAPLAEPIAPVAPAVSVEFAGITEGSGQWWDASGKLLPQGLYSTNTYHHGENDYWRKAGAEHKPRLDFAFRVLPASAKDVTVRFSPESAHMPWSSTIGSWPEKMLGQDSQTETQLNRDTNGLRVFSAIYDAPPIAAPFTVKIASGPWTVATTGNVSVEGPAQSFGSHAYFFSQLFETNGNSRVIISTNDTENDVRVVAVTPQGQEVLPTEIGDSSASSMSQITALFALPAAQIKAIRFETRPFREVKIKAIAVHPAH